MTGTDISNQAAPLSNRSRIRRFSFYAVLIALLTLLVIIAAEFGARVMWPQFEDDDVYLQALYWRALNSDTGVGRDHPNYDPNLGFKHRPNGRRMVKTPEFEYEVFINSLGFRTGELSPTTNAARRLMLLGDSMFEGVGTHEDDRVASQLTNLSRSNPSGTPVEAYNFAVRGYDTAQALAVLRRYGAELRPDRVMLGFFVGNDFISNYVATITPASEYRIADERLQQVKRWLRDAHPGPLWHSRIYRALNLRGVVVRTRYRLSARPEVLERSCGWIEKVAQETRGLGAQLDVVIFYPKHAVKGGFLAWWSESVEAGKGVASCARDRDLEVVDLIDEISGADDAKKYYWAVDGHLNAAGEHRLAEILWEHINNKRTGERTFIERRN